MDAIDAGKVRAVMVGGKWFEVEPDSFRLISYDYMGSRGSLWPGEGDTRLIADAGFSFWAVGNGHLGGGLYKGPISAVQMVRLDPPA